MPLSRHTSSDSRGVHRACEFVVSSKGNSRQTHPQTMEASSEVFSEVFWEFSRKHKSPRKWRQFRRSQPPQGTASYSCDLRVTYLRWASQEPTKVATVAQIAAPQGTASYSCDLRMTYLRWASQEPTKVATVAQIAAPRGRRGPTVIPVKRHSARPPSSLRTWRQFRRSQPPPSDGEVT